MRQADDTYHVTGISPETRELCKEWIRKIEDNWTLDTPDPPPLAVAKKMYEFLPKRESYKGDFGPDFWARFKRFDLPKEVQHWMKKEALKAEADKAGYKSEKLDQVLMWLEKGVDIGCHKETARMATTGTNMESAYEHGEIMTDTIQHWCMEGIAAGPYTREELEDLGFKNIKVNPMQVRVKMNGKLRIILDLSWPHLTEEQEKAGEPNSVNSGINKAKYSTKMADTREVLKTLYRVGRKAEFTKVDWTSAYKHLGSKGHESRFKYL